MKTLIQKARDFHGHICPFLALGVRASALAMERLGVKRLGVDESVKEEILAIVECNNCFTDGVQVATGCTLGNNCLIYFDLGKNAVTLVKRDEWDGVRVYIDGEKLKENYFPKSALELFDKVVAKRSGSDEERRFLSKMWEEVGYKMLEIPESEFKVERVKVQPIERAPMFMSVRCCTCGELTMATRAVRVSERDYCIKCAERPYRAVIGRGIVELGGK